MRLLRLTPLLALAACNGNGSTTQLPAGFGRFANLCTPCQKDDQCGQGGLCTTDVSGGGVCSVSCASHADCALGFQCYALGAGQQGGACLPANNAACPQRPPNTNNNGSDGGTPAMNGNDSGTPTNPGNPDAMDMTPPDSGVPTNPTMFPTCTQDTWSGWASNFVQANCIRCHADYSYMQVEHLSVSIRRDVQAGTMPKDTMLSSDDVTRFLRWIDCDMPP